MYYRRARHVHLCDDSRVRMTILFKVIETLMLVIMMPILLFFSLMKMSAAFSLLIATRICEIWSKD